MDKKVYTIKKLDGILELELFKEGDDCIIVYHKDSKLELESSTVFGSFKKVEGNETNYRLELINPLELKVIYDLEKTDPQDLVDHLNDRRSVDGKVGEKEYPIGEHPNPSVDVYLIRYVGP